MRALILLGICSLLVTWASPAAAQPGGSGKNGLFGEIRLGGGVLSARPSGLEVMEGNERLGRLDAREDRQTDGFGMIGGEVGYGFENTGTTLLVGVGIEDPFYLSLRQETGAWGELTLSALYEKQKVWENPYLSGVTRSRTDAESVGFALNWDQVLSSDFRLVLKQMQIDISRDRIGQLEQGLRRDGTDTTLGLGYDWDWGPGGVLSPSLSHTWIERDGKSNSGCEYVAVLKHEVALGRLSFATHLEVSQTHFDREHPLFQQTREQTAYGIAETITLTAPFGFENWSLMGFAAYRKTNANITFFDGSGVLLGTGLGYRF